MPMQSYRIPRAHSIDVQEYGAEEADLQSCDPALEALLASLLLGLHLLHQVPDLLQLGADARVLAAQLLHLLPELCSGLL